MKHYTKKFNEQENIDQKLTLWDGTKIKIVNGNEIRNKIEIDFIGGGHGYAYPGIIPKDEIWIEDMESKEDMQDILIHEIIEYIFEKYANIKYNKAHNIANDVEVAIRYIKNLT